MTDKKTLRLTVREGQTIRLNVPGEIVVKRVRGRGRGRKLLAQVTVADQKPVDISPRDD